MIEIGERVECTDRKSIYLGERGTFAGFLANAFKIRFDSGKEGLFLACDFKKLE